MKMEIHRNKSLITDEGSLQGKPSNQRKAARHIITQSVQRNLLPIINYLRISGKGYSVSSVFQPYLPECGTATGGVCEDLASAVWLPACMQRETTGRSLATTAVTLYSSTSTVLYCTALQCQCNVVWSSVWGCGSAGWDDPRMIYRKQGSSSFTGCSDDLMTCFTVG